MNSTYKMIATSGENTVVSDYKPIEKSRNAYQSEAQLEETLIDQLTKQGYERVDINNEADLIINLRKQLEKLNNYTFTDSEWDRFYKNIIANDNFGIVEKTKMIQEDNIQPLIRDNGEFKNIKLIDRKDPQRNFLQVLNQYSEDRGTYDNRYDVTILVNGLPLVHTELKRRGVDLKEAFNQIERYQRDSFWAGSGLFEYIQIFIISNGTITKYYSNTTRDKSIKEQTENKKSGRKTSNSYEFTSYWADAKNKKIPDLVDFTRTFLSRHTLLNILTKYCIFTTDENLLVMRPYQITATERILNKIRIANNYKKAGSTDAGGYIWHTTGSGKTVTSYKAARLATEELDFIDKVIFVVDRKDLDSQTIKEYNRFQEGCANGNTSTKILERQLSDPDKKIIVTTIQKLNTFVKKHKNHPVYNQDVVLIFDECHRSQFGEMHKNITKNFKKYYKFGFTGTPIFAENAGSGKNRIFTTQQAFGDRLHAYTIVSAIDDHNVLPFSIDTVNTFHMKEGVKDRQVQAIDEKAALESLKRKKLVAQYILDNFDIKTMRNKSYLTNDNKRLNGFNSLFAVSSVEDCKTYYEIFRDLQKDSEDKLKIATIFSYAPNEEQNETGTLEEDLTTDRMDLASRNFLDMAIGDYNEMFGTGFDSSGEGFQNYYEDLTRRIKNREIDIVIVCNMLLTGFDSTTLNTLWVDKNLKLHGLIQAFSRTNRILNGIKTFGNIVTFRDLTEETNEALKLFGDENAQSLVILKSYDEYYNGYVHEGKSYPGYKEIVAEIQRKFPDPHDIGITNEVKKEFVGLFSSLLRVMNILSTFERFEREKLINDADFQDYMSAYLDLQREMIGHTEKVDIVGDMVFELELARHLEVDIDFILFLIGQIEDNYASRKEITAQVNRRIDSSIKLRSKKELINNFIDRYNAGEDSQKKWIEFVEQEKEKELEAIIEEENLKPEKTRDFINNCLLNGKLETTGMALSEIMPRMSRFSPNREKKRNGIIHRLLGFIAKFAGIIFFL